MKCYQVIFVDEYNNFYELGYYKNLIDAESDINEYLKQYSLSEDSDIDPGAVPEFGENRNLDRLAEYPGTYGPVFDRVIDVEEGSVAIRGFVIDSESLIKNIKELEGKHE